MKKGFTLIELLAVIVILAVIALLVTPVISNIIERTRKSAAIDSANHYKSAIDNAYAMNMLENSNTKLDGTYTLSGDNLIGDDTFKIDVSGAKPTGGYVEYEDNVLVDACLEINGYKVVYEDGKFVSGEKGSCGTIDMTPYYYAYGNENVIYGEENIPSNWPAYVKVTPLGQKTYYMPREYLNASEEEFAPAAACNAQFSGDNDFCIDIAKYKIGGYLYVATPAETLEECGSSLPDGNDAECLMINGYVSSEAPVIFQTQSECERFMRGDASECTTYSGVAGKMSGKSMLPEYVYEEQILNEEYDLFAISTLTFSKTTVYYGASYNRSGKLKFTSNVNDIINYDNLVNTVNDVVGMPSLMGSEPPFEPYKSKAACEAAYENCIKVEHASVKRQIFGVTTKNGAKVTFEIVPDSYEKNKETLLGIFDNYTIDEYETYHFNAGEYEVRLDKDDSRFSVYIANDGNFIYGYDYDGDFVITNRFKR